MAAPNDVHVVIGGAGGTGAALVVALLGRGHRVRSVSRRGMPGPPGSEAVAADVAIPSQALDATHGAAVIYQAAQPAYHRWTADFPPMQTALLAAAEAHNSKLVMADNLYLYGPVEGSMREDTPPHPLGKKGGTCVLSWLRSSWRSIAPGGCGWRSDALRTTSDRAASTRPSASSYSTRP
jgi:nucleoside-diphosphate-sugar epimerase